MHLPPSFEPDAHEEGLRFVVRGVGAPGRQGALAAIGAWGLGGIGLSAPSGLFLLGNTGPDYVPAVSLFAACMMAVGLLVGSLRVALEDPRGLPVSAELALDPRGLSVGEERVAWADVRSLHLTDGTLSIDRRGARLEVSCAHHHEADQEALVAVLREAHTRFGGVEHRDQGEAALRGLRARSSAT